MSTPKPKSVDEYISNFPIQTQEKLLAIREILLNIAPNAIEEIKWGVPVLTGKRILFSFSGFKNHVTFMPTGPALLPFKEDLSKYKTGKDTIQFPLDQELPIDLISKIARHRMQEVEEHDAKWKY